LAACVALVVLDHFEHSHGFGGFTSPEADDGRPIGGRDLLELGAERPLPRRTREGGVAGVIGASGSLARGQPGQRDHVVLRLRVDVDAVGGRVGGRLLVCLGLFEVSLEGWLSEQPFPGDHRFGEGVAAVPHPLDDDLLEVVRAGHERRVAAVDQVYAIPGTAWAAAGGPGGTT
jgi:hypothetical protein